MRCCGKKSLKKIKHIAQAKTKQMLNVPTPKFAKARLYICKNDCGKVTYLSELSYIRFIVKHGISFFKHFDDLSVLPDLPKQEQKPGTKPYCMICKCDLEGKTRIEDEHCPLKPPKW